MDIISDPQAGIIILSSGKMFNFLEPKSDDFDILDIAHALSMTCRFGGAPRKFYSVAQHSFYVSYMVHPSKAKAAMLHDGTEAYLHDLCPSVKVLFPEYEKMENTLGGKLALAFDLAVNAFEDPVIKTADNQIQRLEATVLINTSDWFWKTVGGRPDGSLFDIDPNFIAWTPEAAERAFLGRYMEIQSEGHLP